MVAAKGYEEWKIQSCLTSTEFPFCKMKRILILIVQYESTEHYLNVHLKIKMIHFMLCISSVLFSRVLFSRVLFSRVRLFATPGIAACQASLSITNSQSSLRLNVHRVRDAIQPSHPLSSPSPPAPNPSQQQSLFPWVNSSHEVAEVLEFQL